MKVGMRLLLVGLLFGCGLMAVPDRTSQPGVSAESKNEVTMTNYKFEPKKLTVTEGTTVIWNNKEGAHIVKSDTDVFASKTLKVGENFSYEFTKAGTYPYHCSFHGNKGGHEMAGTIVVVKKK